MNAFSLMGNVVKTSVLERNYKFLWIVEKASKLPLDVDVKNSVFIEGLTWNFSFRKQETYISLQVIRDYSQIELQNDIEVKLLDCKGKVYYENKIEKYYNDLGNRLRISFSNIESAVLNELKCAPHDTWYFVFQIKTCEFNGKAKTKIPSQQKWEDKMKHSFCFNFWKMFENKIGTDVTLQVQDRQIEAHKFVLSAQSPVFAKMFETPMSESEKNTVVIDDVSGAAMTLLINFIYSKAENECSFETAMELYYAADKYEVFELRELCGKILTCRLAEDNAGVLLEMADKHKDDCLKSKVMDFINYNIRSCIKKDWWYELISKKSELGKELMNFIK